MSQWEERVHGGGDSKGRSLYQESVKWPLARFIKLAPEPPQATKVTNQVVAGQRQDASSSRGRDRMYIIANQLRLQKLRSTRFVLCYKGGATSIQIPLSKKKKKKSK